MDLIAGLSAMFIISLLALLFGPSMVVGVLAEKRGRSFWGWTFLALFFCFLIVLVFLLAFGETDEKREERIKKETEIKVLEEIRIRKALNRTEEKTETPREKDESTPPQSQPCRTLNDTFANSFEERQRNR